MELIGSFQGTAFIKSEVSWRLPLVRRSILHTTTDRHHTAGFANCPSVDSRYAPSCLLFESHLTLHTYLGIGIFFLPYSPRWLVNQGRDEEAVAVLANVRGLPESHDLVQIEFLEIRAEHLFEQETSAAKWPELQDGSRASYFKLGWRSYKSLLTSKGWRTCTISASAHIFHLLSALPSCHDWRLDDVLPAVDWDQRHVSVHDLRYPKWF